MRWFVAVSLGIALFGRFASVGVASPVELSVYGDAWASPAGGSPAFQTESLFSGYNYQIPDSFQSGQFVAVDQPNGVERPASGWSDPPYGTPQYGPFSEAVSGNFAITLYFTSPNNPAQQSSLQTLYGWGSAPGIPWIVISGNLTGTVMGDGTSDIGAALQVSNLQIQSGNWSGSGFSPALLSTFSDPDRIQVAAYVTGGFMNDFELTLTILPPAPQAVPEPESFAAFGAAFASLALWRRRRFRR